MEIVIGLYAVCLLGIQATHWVTREPCTEQVAEQHWPKPFSFI